MNLYSTSNFGKDCVQWTKCVITYLSEYFEQCQIEDNSSNSSYYYKWIVFLTELLDKNTNNLPYQSCVLICLSALLSFISFSEPKTWTFINEELMQVIVKYMNTNLWSEALDLIKLTVSKSSSLAVFAADKNRKQPNPKFFLGNTTDSLINATNLSAAQQIPTQSFFSKKELPGRTLEFDFDFSLFIPAKVDKLPTQMSSPSSHAAASTKSSKSQPQTLQQMPQTIPPLNLLSFSKESSQYIHSNSFHNGWKRPHLSQYRTREKIVLLLNTFNKNQPVSNIVNTPVSVTNQSDNFKINNNNNQDSLSVKIQSL